MNLVVQKIIRGFEIVSAYEDHGMQLPVRKTSGSAGYDIEAAAQVELKPRAVTLVPTGLKAFMGHDEYLAIHIRSGISIKRGLMLVNSTGIIDSDYYNNDENEGHILIAFYNTNDTVSLIEKGERVAQGIFSKYLLAAEDHADGVRTGGIGSTGK